jgi:hypothetical protein
MAEPSKKPQELTDEQREALGRAYSRLIRAARERQARMAEQAKDSNDDSTESKTARHNGKD